MSKAHMRLIERFLINLDSWPWSAVYRVALGLGVPPVFGALSGWNHGIWDFPVFFIGVLTALRVVPAALRRVLPFSAEAKKVWAERRNIAKRHDSYQWQKLFWIGLGLLPHAFIGGGLGSSTLPVTLICLVGGGVGLLFWRQVDVARAAT